MVVLNLYDAKAQLSSLVEEAARGREIIIARGGSAIALADIVWVSAVSGWEASIKASLGRLRITEPFAVSIAADDFTELPMTLAHAARLQDLPPHHSDPFDRMLIAQAVTERATIVSHDRALAPYGAAMIWT